MKLQVLLCILVSSVVSQNVPTIIDNNPLTATTARTCNYVVFNSDFGGSCCSLTVQPGNSCLLTVSGGTCVITGEVWNLNYTSTEGECPPSDIPAEWLGLTSPPSMAPVTETPTPAPVTVSPTPAPVTSSPTPAPSTSKPTSQPTTSSPSDAPSVAPSTSSPTATPSGSPTASPTSNPSDPESAGTPTDNVFDSAVKNDESSGSALLVSVPLLLSALTSFCASI